MIEQRKDCVIILRTNLLRHLTHTEALFLSQLDYWLDRYGHLVDGHYWIRNTTHEWARQLGLSERQINRTIDHLIELGLIERARKNRHTYDRTWSYRICYEALTALTGVAARYSPKTIKGSLPLPTASAPSTTTTNLTASPPREPQSQATSPPAKTTRVLYAAPPPHINTARHPGAARPRTAAERRARRDYIASVEAGFAAERATPIAPPDFKRSKLFATLPEEARAVFLHCAAATQSPTS